MTQREITAHRLNAIREITGGSRYLEIGLWKAETLRLCSYPIRYGVEPNPQFSPAELAREGIECFLGTSDEFFLRGVGEMVFDTVFIDGLHLFEQALRDFLNSLSHSHRKAVWLIDDVTSADFTPALRDLRTATAVRSALHITSGLWHGDVY